MGGPYQFHSETSLEPDPRICLLSSIVCKCAIHPQFPSCSRCTLGIYRYHPLHNIALSSCLNHRIRNTSNFTLKLAFILKPVSYRLLVAGMMLSHWLLLAGMMLSHQLLVAGMMLSHRLLVAGIMLSHRLLVADIMLSRMKLCLFASYTYKRKSIRVF